MRLILAIYSKINDEEESVDEDNEDTALKIEEELKVLETAEKIGYNPVPIDEKKGEVDSPANNLIDGKGEVGEDFELV